MKSMEQFILCVVPLAMKSYYRSWNSHVVVEDANQVNSPTDVIRAFIITFNRGACLVAMMNGFMGYERLHKYLKERSYKAA